MKWGSLLLMIFWGSLNHQNRCSIYNWAMPVPMMVVEQGRKIAACEHPWSTMVSMASCPLLSGNLVMRSMVM
jgi:hypothetical protein